MKSANEKTVAFTLTRRQLVDLMLACSWMAMEMRMADGPQYKGQRWDDLHTRLAEVLRNHDRKEEVK